MPFLLHLYVFIGWILKAGQLLSQTLCLRSKILGDDGGDFSEISDWVLDAFVFAQLLNCSHGQKLCLKSIAHARGAISRELIRVLDLQ